MPEITKTGYVKSYKLELHTDPMLANAKVYFSVTITDDSAGNQNPETFIFERNMSSGAVDGNSTGIVWAVSYGNVQQAMIATLKDALLHKKRVIVHAVTGVGPVLGGQVILVNRLSAVEIQQ